MKREKCLAYRQRVIDESFRQRDLVQTLPLNSLVLFTFRDYFREKSAWMSTQILAIPVLFNLTTIRCNILTVKDKGSNFDSYLERAYHPGNMEVEKFNILLALKFSLIEAWSNVDPIDLPLFIGHDTKFPKFSHVLKGSP